MSLQKAGPKEHVVLLRSFDMCDFEDAGGSGGDRLETHVVSAKLWKQLVFLRDPSTSIQSELV